VLPDSFLVDMRNFCMPTPSRIVTSNYGSRWGRQHKGIDIKVYTGDTIRSAFTGKVRMVKYERRGYGHYVVIRHDNGLETIYAHLSRSLVKENQPVKAGEVIGLGGNTGRSTGSHLHFETRICGVAINPAILFDFRNQDIVADTYMFRRNTYNQESYAANRLRGKVNGGRYTREQVTGEQEVVVQSVDDNSTVEHRARYHKVRKGETLSAIARKHGISVKKLCSLNRISKTKRIKPGQLLRYS
jgi:murein DD-endopeptidase MepM/ murein hydrolase activator NlpD